MHVLTAAHDFYPDPGSGGTGRYVYETARRLVDRGHRVSVVTRRRGDVPARESVEGVDVHRYDLEVAERAGPAVLAQLPGAAATVADHVSAIADRSPVDVLSAQGPMTSLLVDRHVGDAAARVPTFHSPWPTEYRIRTRNERWEPRRRLNSTIRWHAERTLLAGADHAVTLSEFMGGELRETYGLDLDASVVPGGVDAERYTPEAGSGEAGSSEAGSADRIDSGAPAFLTVRRLAERMGHEPLLRAFAAVVERHPEAHLYVAGDGPLRGRLDRLAASLGLDDHVTFLGYVPDPALPSVYASADVFVLPTTELEGFGLATLEALASGLPVFATPVGGSVEVLSDLAGGPAIPAPTLAASADAGALADGLDAWAGVSEEALAEAGRAARRYARERYPWERTVDGLVSIYREAASIETALAGPSDADQSAAERRPVPR